MENNGAVFPTIPLTSSLSITKIHSLFYYEFPKDFYFSGECHDFWELIYVDKGTCYFTRQGERIDLQTGDIVLIRPNDHHAVCGNGTSMFNVLILSFTCKSKALSAFPSSPATITSTTRDVISKIIREARHAFRLPIIDPFATEIAPLDNALFGSRQLVKNYLEELLILLLREEYVDKNDLTLSTLANGPANPTNLVEAVEKYLLDNLNKTLSIPAICETFHYSKNYICSRFKEKTGYTIIEYFNRAKIERAKELIRERSGSLSKISETLGFSSPGYFSKTFKRVTGLSPMEYQRSLRRLFG